jgi:predicted transport protein
LALCSATVTWDVQKRTLRTHSSAKSICSFHELDDPKRMAKDVINIGHWGNGDVDVGVSSLDELPYIMGLVRQAFEKQMGQGDVDI